MKERNLKKAVTLVAEPVELVVRARDDKSKRTRTKQSEQTERKTMSRVSSKGRDAAKIAKPKRTSKVTAGAEAIDDMCMAEMKALGRETLSAQSLITADDLSRTDVTVSASAGLQELLSLQNIGASAGVQKQPAMASSRNCGAECESEDLASDGGIEEREIGTPQKLAENTTDAVTAQSTTSQRGTPHWFAGAWKWALKHLRSGHARKRLRVCESVSLGEKRFVAVIEVDGEQFLVGGASSSVATLARLGPSQVFSDVLKQRWAQDPIQA
jgi:Flagellar biosynthesis protein, FliO